MSKKYPGGLIRKTPPTITPPVGGEGGSAPGVWTLEQASYYIKQGTWPLPTLPRYLYSWGDGRNGQLGLNDLVYRSSPVQVGADTNWGIVSAGKNFRSSAALKTDGTLWMWGANNAGQLGLNDQVNRSSPTQVGALTNWLTVAAGGYHTLAVKTDGTLWAWGDGGSGRLGTNNIGSLSSPTQIGALTNWASVAAGNEHSLALKTDGTIWSWGSNGQGQLGQSIAYYVYRSSPVQIGSESNWSAVSCGNTFSGARKTNGTVWMWGNNASGQLGQTNRILRSSPVQVGTLTTWSDLALGGFHTLARTTSNTLFAWGLNDRGQLGLNIAAAINRSSPVQVGALNTWVSISGGYTNTVAKQSNNTLWTWGAGGAGQLGISNTANVSSPVQVGALTKWENISSGFNDTLATIKG